MNTFIRATIALALTNLIAAAAQAQVHPEKPTYKYEKCYAVAKAGKNDCFTAKHACAGTATQDNESDSWIYTPAGTCDKIADGSLSPKQNRQK